MKKLNTKTKKQKVKLQDLNFSPSEKITIILPNGVLVNLESAEKNLDEMSLLSINAVNSILQFNENLKSKTKRSYISWNKDRSIKGKARISSTS